MFTDISIPPDYYRDVMKRQAVVNAGVTFRLRNQNGAAFDTEDFLYENGIANGVEGLRIIDRDALVGKEPNISDAAVAALWAPTGGIVCPFGLTFALAENAAKNGVQRNTAEGRGDPDHRT